MDFESGWELTPGRRRRQRTIGEDMGDITAKQNKVRRGKADGDGAVVGYSELVRSIGHGQG